MYLFVLNNYMLSTKNSYLFFLVVLCSALTILSITYGDMIFDELLPIKGIVAAIGMFTILEMLSVWFLESRSRKQNPRQSVNILLGLKVGKMLLALLFILIYALAGQVEIRRFTVAFLVLYLIYLFSNTTYLSLREKGLKSASKTKQVTIE
ncbi:MAG: hypothetical protein LBE79_11065 [Tannerella sp.]|nr:hypothetical protein [Tannerella sp.]